METRMMKKGYKIAIVALILFAIIWGLAFASLAQDNGVSWQTALQSLQHVTLSALLAAVISYFISLAVDWVMEEDI